MDLLEAAAIDALPTTALLEQAWASARSCETEGYEEAVALFRSASARNPGCAQACAGLAEAYAHWGFRRELEGLESRSYYRLALEHAELGVELDPNSAHARRGLSAALRRGEGADPERRLKQARLAVQLDPHAAESWYELWRASGYALDDPSIRNALSMRPKYFAALHDLGVALCEHDRPVEALRFLERAIAVNPGSGLARYNRAMALESLGRVQEARSELRALAQARPQDPLCLDALRRLESIHGP